MSGSSAHQSMSECSSSDGEPTEPVRSSPVRAFPEEAGEYPAPAPPTSPPLIIDEEFDDTGSLDREYDGTFEGPEKTLEACFRPGKSHTQSGCRGLPRESLDRILRKARCTIMSCISNAHLDAYVLSESSLFVYPYKVVLKTCGTTTLLRCLPQLLHEAKTVCGCELEWVGYSRKNYTFPNGQLFPHTSFSDELGYLQKHSRYYDKLKGSAHILGPLTGDHWFVYVADKCERPAELAKERTLNLMMFDMHEDAASIFYKDRYATAEEQTRASGICDLVPGATIDAQNFEPCGYSMNSVHHASYSTIHITPESECSYASFETNTALKSYTALIRNVLRIFRPRRFVVTMFADDAGLGDLSEDPFDDTAVMLPGFGVYTQSNAASNTVVETDTVCRMATWELNEKAFDRTIHQHRMSRRTATFS